MPPAPRQDPVWSKRHPEKSVTDFGNLLYTKADEIECTYMKPVSHIRDMLHKKCVKYGLKHEMMTETCNVKLF